MRSIFSAFCGVLIFISFMSVSSLAQNENQKTDLTHFQKALSLISQNKSAEALAELQDPSLKNSTLKDYASYYRGLLLKQLQRPAEALVEFHQVDLKDNSLQLRIETQYQMSEIFLSQGKYAQAAPLLRPLERQARGTDKYAEVIFNLARLEKGLQNHVKKCTYLRKLYSKFPIYPSVKEWGYDLAAASFEGQPTKCALKDDEFRQRMRNLLWAGEDKKALSEINEMKTAHGAENQFQIDQMMAAFELQAGEPQKAFQILKPYAEKYKNNISFLLLYASTAARASEVQLSVGAYYQVFKLAPRTAKGRSSLYQSAFLSYQFQDYDGAVRRFQEFIKLGANPKLSSEAKWHLAWLKYLKGDYSGAYKSMKALSQVRTRKAVTGRDRLQYWMGVSLLKMGQVGSARTELLKISKDPLMGYYSMAAQARLKKMESLEKNKKESLEIRPVIARFSAGETMSASIDDFDTTYDEQEESSEAEVTQVLEDAKSDSEDVAETDGLGDQKVSDVEGEAPTTGPGLELKSPQLMKKFERARNLIALGLQDWAKWDLYDIEKKTRNKEHLKALMGEYTAIDYFHRSSYIGQVNFGALRKRSGIDGARNIWEYAYPQAYGGVVKKYSKEYGVPSEYIYGIMKAESSFRKEALSPVGAIGLMQVMPLTGRKVAELASIRDFESTQLLKPTMAIQVGSKYLQRLLKKFDQVFPLVAASYNAGPHRVKSWLNSFGYLETDEFIEHIPFLETRNYVKKVMSNANVYKKLYGNAEIAFPYLADALPFKYDEKAPLKETWEEL